MCNPECEQFDPCNEDCGEDASGIPYGPCHPDCINEDCKITITDDGNEPAEYYCVGQTIEFCASGCPDPEKEECCDCVDDPAPNNDFTWTVTGGASIVGDDTGDCVTIEITDPGEFTVSVGKGCCRGKIEDRTSVRAQLDVARVIGNYPTQNVAGYLDDERKDDPGAFLPLNNDDDNYSGNPDHQDSGDIEGENDLLPIVLRVIEPASAGGEYTLNIPSHVRVWESDDRTGAVDNSTIFPADVERELWVEGIAENVGELALIWTNGEVECSDKVTLTVFTWEGPLNVPGYGKYRYLVTGADFESQWITPVHGTWVESIGPSEIEILWGEGPNVGRARYQASEDYIWDLEVNVVQIAFNLTGSAHGLMLGLNAPGSPVQDSVNGAIIKAHHTHPGFIAAIEVTRIEGPTRGNDPRSRGVRFIELGMLQNVTVTSLHAVFPNNNVKTWVGVGGNPTWQNVTLVDAWDAQPGPWYNEANDPDGVPNFGQGGEVSNWHEPTLDTPVVQSFLIGLLDTPEIMFPAQVHIPPNTFHWLQEQSLTWNFNIYLGARTIQTASSADERFIQRAAGSWRFHANGTFGGPPSHTWTPITAGTDVVSQMSEVQTGATFSPIAPPTFNSIIGLSTDNNVWTGGTGQIVW